MENLILDALKNTSNGNWIIENEEIERAGIDFKDFLDKLESDNRVCEYELIDGGIDILFWLKYCENIEEED